MSKEEMFIDHLSEEDLLAEGLYAVGSGDMGRDFEESWRYSIAHDVGEFIKEYGAKGLFDILDSSTIEAIIEYIKEGDLE